MTFLAIQWLSISINLLLVIFVIVCVLMTLIILMQRPKQEGLGAAFGGGVTDQVFGARTTNVLQRGTVYLGSFFFIISLLLAVLIGQRNKTYSILTAEEKAAKTAPAIPAAPAAPKDIIDQIPADVTPPVDTPAPADVPADAPTEATPPAESAPAPTTPETTPATPGSTAPPVVPENAPAGDKSEGP